MTKTYTRRDSALRAAKNQGLIAGTFDIQKNQDGTFQIKQSKKAMAMVLYVSLGGDRQAVIKAFQTIVKLSVHGSNTYFYACKKQLAAA